jgi:hypothetical protein
MEKSKYLSMGEPIRLRSMEAKIIRLAFIPVAFIQLVLLISIGFDLINALGTQWAFTQAVDLYALYSMNGVVLISALMTFYVMTLYAYYGGLGSEPLGIFRGNCTRVCSVSSWFRVLSALLILAFIFTSGTGLLEASAVSLFSVLLASELVWWSLKSIVRHLYVSEIIDTAVVEHGFRGNE